MIDKEIVEKIRKKVVQKAKWSALRIKEQNGDAD